MYPPILLTSLQLAAIVVDQLDEIRLVIHPLIAGKGRRLFDGLNLQDQLGFKLVETKLFKSGHVALSYVN